MKRFVLLLVLLLSLGLVAAQCGGANPPAAKEAAKEAPKEEAKEAAKEESKETAKEAAAPSGKEVNVVIGFTASKTGEQEVPSSGQTRGLESWLESVKAGITLADGTVVKFTAVSYDDESKKERVQQLYTKLINEDKADFLISPYSSGLAEAAAFTSEEYGKVMITTGAASDETYKKGFKAVFQLYTPASRYLTGAIDFLANQDPTAKKIAFVYENAKFSTDVVEAAKVYATSKGYEVVMAEGYDPKTTDFAPFINKIAASKPDAIMGGGHFNDGTSFARQLSEKQIPIKAVVLLVAPPELKFAEVGDAAIGIIGPSQWEPGANYTAEAAKAAGMEWYGLTVPDFIKLYQAKHNEEPSYHAAGGYAAGLLLQNAIETAGSTDQEKVKEVMNKMNLLTFYGAIKFNTTAETHGLQDTHSMVYIQWQKGADGKLVKQVIWPLEGKSADPIYPVR